MLARAENPADVEGVLSDSKDYGYLNDAQFAESFAAARLENAGLDNPESSATCVTVV